ncbi:hypothetical protein ACS0TY_035446 [Phlomoides rotata]
MKKSSSSTAPTCRWISTGVIVVLMLAANTECSRIALQQTLTNLHKFPPSPPPPVGEDGAEIDPRYGVEKRLVPSGPNPLHN